VLYRKLAVFYKDRLQFRLQKDDPSTMRYFNGFLAFFVALSVVYGQERILFVSHNSWYSGGGINAVSILRSFGVTVDHVWLTNNPGVVKNALETQEYSQVWSYDLFARADGADFSGDYKAIADWQRTPTLKDIIADGRFLSSMWDRTGSGCLRIPIALPGFAPSDVYPVF
jgi:hypothetical protein